MGKGWGAFLPSQQRRHWRLCPPNPLRPEHLFEVNSSDRNLLGMVEFHFGQAISAMSSVMWWRACALALSAAR
jgi:hypothetical protein